LQRYGENWGKSEPRDAHQIDQNITIYLAKEKCQDCKKRHWNPGQKEVHRDSWREKW